MRKFTGLLVLILAMAVGMPGCSGSSSSDSGGGAVHGGGSVATALVGNADITVHVRPGGQDWRLANDSERAELFGVTEPKTNSDGFFSFNAIEAANYKGEGTLIRITVGDGAAENGHLNGNANRPFTGKLQAIMVEPGHFSVNFGSSLLASLADKVDVRSYNTLEAIARDVHEIINAAARGMGNAGGSLTFKDLFNGAPAVTEQTLLAALVTLAGTGEDPPPAITNTGDDKDVAIADLKELEEEINLTLTNANYGNLQKIINVYTNEPATRNEVFFVHVPDSINKALELEGALTLLQSAFLAVYAENYRAMTGRDAQDLTEEVKKPSTALDVYFALQVYREPEDYNYSESFGSDLIPAINNDLNLGARQKGLPISNTIPYHAEHPMAFYFRSVASDLSVGELIQEEWDKLDRECGTPRPEVGDSWCPADYPQTQLSKIPGIRLVSILDDAAAIKAKMNPREMEPYIVIEESYTGGASAELPKDLHGSGDPAGYNLLIKVDARAAEAISAFTSLPIRVEVETSDGRRERREVTLTFEKRDK